MDRVINKPYQIFWFSIPIIILFGLTSGDNYLDVNLHDTMFVVANSYIAKIFLILFGLIGFGYWLMHKFRYKLSKWLNFIHIVLTIGGFIIIWMLILIFSESNFKYGNLYSNKITRNLFLTILTLIIIIGQLIYLTNIIGGLIRKRNK